VVAVLALLTIDWPPIHGYSDQDFLNYYYYMASQFALSDRWFSPLASKSVANRLATFTGGTTRGYQGPGQRGHLPQSHTQHIQDLINAKVSWKITTRY